MKRLDSKPSSGHQKTTSAQTVASIDDLLLEIFVRLRLKPLVCFKSVSKHWNSIISDPKLHLSRPNPAVGLIIYPTKLTDRFFAYAVPFEKPGAPTLVEFPKAVNSDEATIMHSCNGLLVCDNNNDDTERDFIVFNPTTMTCTTLPEPMHSKRILGMCLAFDPSESPHYKVVCVSGRRRCLAFFRYNKFQVYSSETGSWRYTSMETFTGNLDIRNGVYWNGALHWIPDCWNQDSNYFNPDDEEPRVFPTPPTPYWNDHGYTNYFGESGGHLHFVGQAVTTELTVYEMRRDYSEWFVKYRVHHSIWTLLRGRVHIGGSHYICALFRGRKDEDCFLVLWDKRRTIRHNVVCGTFETLHDLPYPCYGVPLPYFESICHV